MANYRELASALGAGLARWLLLVGGLAATVACGQKDPDDPIDGADLQPYFPLVAGAWWDYQHSDWVERVTVEPADFNGASASRMSDSPNPGDADQIRSDSVITSVDGRAARVLKEEYRVGTDGSETLTSSVSYGTGFTRFNEDWANQAVGYRETPEYERVETRPGESPRAPEARRHTFEVIALADELTTPKGTFTCIVIQRSKDWEGDEAAAEDDEVETKRYWFARGVGKVQELNLANGNTEILTDFLIPSP
jgi:hypothetical protein